MGLRINQNIAALNAARNLRKTDDAMSRSLERLSSGFRVNRAADDPAGLIISENLRAQISGLSQAVRNSQNAVSLVKTAEAALDEVLTQLRSIRTLALDALNTGASDAVARSADQTQISSSIATLTRIGNTTQFGKIKLLDGSAGISGTTSDATVLTFVSATENTQTGTYNVSGITAAQQGSQEFKLFNEFDEDAADATVSLGASSVLAFRVDLAASLTSQSDIDALAADLLAGGLVANDTSVTGVRVLFDATNATADVIVDRGAASFTADLSDNTLVNALNGTKLGEFITFRNGATDNELRLTGKYAGLRFSVSDVTAKTNFKAGVTNNTAVVTAAAAYVSTTGDTVTLTIDFATNLTASETTSLGASLAAAGLANVAAFAGTDGTYDLVFDQANATVTVTSVASAVITVAEAIADLNDNVGNLGRFVVFSNSAGNLSVSTAVGDVTFSSAGAATGEAGFSGGAQTTAAIVAKAATEADDLGAKLGSPNSVKLLRETLTFNGTNVISVATGTLVVNLANVLNQQLTAAGIGITSTFTADADTVAATGNGDNKLTLKNDAFGNASAVGGSNTVSSNRGATGIPFHLGIGGVDVTIVGSNVSGNINNIAAAGVGQTLTLSSTGNNADGIAVKFTGLVDPTGLTVTVTQGSLQFQVGANTGQVVNQALPDVRASKLGLTNTLALTNPLTLSVADINVTTADGANDALKLVDAAIDEITTKRGALGAFQANVLESTINSLGVARENLAAAESAIRDADFADETVQFTRNQILLQAGTAILTQANAIPQAVLQLLA